MGGRRPRRWALVALLLTVVLAGCGGGGAKAKAGDSLAGVQKVTESDHEHVLRHVSYDRTPPAGGKHTPYWLYCDVYAALVPVEPAVHSMEHGAIWLTYRPGLPADQVKALASLTGLNRDYVLVSPYPGLPAPVVASTWGLQLRVDSATDPRLAAFVKAYAGGNQGGEGGAPCRGGSSVTPGQARQLEQQFGKR